MASPEQRLQQPPPFAAQNPAAQGPPGAGALPGAFANLQISRGAAAPPPGAPPHGLTPQQAPPPFAARPGRPPPPAAARPAFPGSPPAPAFVRAPMATAAPSAAPPFGGPPGAVSQQPPPFGGPPGAASQQPPPFGGPPGVASRAPPPFGGPPSAASQVPPPFGGPPAAVSQASPPLGGPPAVTSRPFGGPSVAASQAPPFGGPPSAGSQPLPFGGPPAMASQPAPPMFGAPRPTFPGQPGPTAAASSQAMPPSFGAPQQPPTPFGGQTQFGGPQPGAQPPFAAQSAPVAQQLPFMGPPRANAPAFGPPSWQTQGAGSGAMQPPMGMPGIPGMQPNTLGPPGTPTMPYSPHAGTQVSTPSKIDPTQIPRPIPEASVIIYETRQGGQATVPPAASSEFIVKDTGNCSPRLMRCTVNQIPCTGDLLTTSAMPLALMVQPFALPHPSEEPIQLVDFGEMGPIRCSRCKAYINPFMKFVDQGRHFICNLCGFRNDTPRDYMCNLGPDGRRRDADERPELCRGTVEFVATKEFLVRDPMPAVYFFLIDVSMNAIQTGATAAACSAIAQAISDLPEGPRTMVGIATFDSAIHFYSLKRAQQQPLMLIVPDVQDVYTPLQTDLILPVSECRENLEQLLESIPNMFENNRVADSAFGAAMKAGFLAIKSTGGKLLVFQSVLPSLGVGSLSAREAEGRANVTTGDKEAHKLLQPVDNTLKTMALEFAEYQVSVDVFLTTQSYVDIASISVVPQTTGGRVYYYYPFSALSDPAKLFNDLRWNISRPQGFEAVMRVRCSQGLQVQDYFGNFCKRVPTDIDLPAIDSDKTVMVTFKHDDKLQENAECGFQCALLYTTVYGQRRIRVINLSLSCTSLLSNLFRYADLETQFACFLKQAANGIPTSPLPRIRDEATNTCINILQSYRKHCASVTSSGQLILPEALKLLPLYTLALVKSVGLRTDGRLDERSYWMSLVSSISVVLAVPLVFPRLIPIHDLTSRADDDSLIPSPLMLNSENVQEDGVYLLENGEDGLIYVGNMVNPATLEQIFGVSSLAALPVQLVLEQFDNELSRKVNEVVNEIRRQRCSYLRLRLCRRGEPSGDFFRSFLIEDKAPAVFSYVEFLVHVHRQIQSKMT
ncbi:LOW QUALITY PROTEIN: protein transport protein Sec24-like At4g32640 [Setaria italica]|uniref:LOW QUALITY PROTEIN: protein transport protein Sec24-like At4g32640 n=1 Tax=Setaria italica TaxID=4555 RepID=UPI0007199E62|nr:LOW QUALITY PROTEIN: protein transport protein Sec24-like At4g32640 [Setaria italica]